jgi:hypothetical protein
VKPFARVPLNPFVLVTVTLTAPAACAGVVAVIVVLLVTKTLVAGTPPIISVAPVVKPLPLIVTEVPPAVVPEFGVILLTFGVGEVDVLKNSAMLGADADAPGKEVSPIASAIVRSVL